MCCQQLSYPSLPSPAISLYGSYALPSSSCEEGMPISLNYHNLTKLQLTQGDMGKLQSCVLKLSTFWWWEDNNSIFKCQLHSTVIHTIRWNSSHKSKIRTRFDHIIIINSTGISSWYYLSYISYWLLQYRWHMYPMILYQCNADYKLLNIFLKLFLGVTALAEVCTLIPSYFQKFFYFTFYIVVYRDCQYWKQFQACIKDRGRGQKRWTLRKTWNNEGQCGATLLRQHVSVRHWLLCVPDLHRNHEWLQQYFNKECCQLQLILRKKPLIPITSI